MIFISTLIRKSIADVTQRKGRTVLIVLGILIAVMGLTAVNQANNLIVAAFLYSANAKSLPNISFSVNTLPPKVATHLQQLPNVGKFQVSTQFVSYWYVTGNTTPETIQINGFHDIQHLQLGNFQLTSGRLPGAGEIVMDISDRALHPVSLGDTVTLDVPDGHAGKISLRVVGLSRTQGRAFLNLQAHALAYMSTDALQQIAASSASSAEHGLQHNSSAFFIGTEIMIQTQNPANTNQTYLAISRVLNAANLSIYASFWTFSSGSSAQVQLGITGLLNIIRILAIIALLLVCLMIVNTVTTLLSEQMKIIGTMKAVGGTRLAIIRSYLLSISIYGVIGTMLGIGLGLLVCYEIASLVTSLTAADLGPFEVPPWVLLVSIATGVLVPLLAALLPLWIGTRITVRDAMSAYGVQTNVNQQASAWGRHLRWVPQTAWLGIRGLFRKPAQALLTLLTLTLSCSVFMAVQVTNASIGATVSHQMHFYQRDVDISIADGDNPIPAQQLITSIQSLPNVARIEPIDDRTVTIATRQLELIGLPVNTQVYQPQVIDGQWLTAQEQGSFVVNQYAAQRLNLHVGKSVTVSLGTKQVSWRLVGIVHETNNVSGSSDTTGLLGDAFTTLASLNLALRDAPADATSRLYVQVHDQSQLALRQVVKQIQHVLNSARVENASVDALALNPPQASTILVVIYSLFDTVAILVALVGLLGLSHTLSASVLERRLEIGILRSLGATSWHVSVVFWIEGLAFTALAWTVGTMIGIPGGNSIVNVLDTFIQPFDFTVSPLSILITFLFAIVVSFVASYGPALSASRVRISEILRYE